MYMKHKAGDGRRASKCAEIYIFLCVVFFLPNDMMLMVKIQCLCYLTNLFIVLVICIKQQKKGGKAKAFMCAIFLFFSFLIKLFDASCRGKELSRHKFNFIPPTPFLFHKEIKKFCFFS